MAGDETPAHEDAADATTEGRPTTRPRTTAAASAASRARRIGGARAASGKPPRVADESAEAADEPAVDADTDTESDVEPAAGATVALSKSTEKASASGKSTTSNEDVAADSSDDPGDAGGPTVVTQVPRWLPWSFAGVLAVCAVVMAVLVVVASHSVWYAKPSTSAVRDRVLASAKTCTAAANTYSYRTLAQDEAKGLACSTGKWTDQYRKAITTLVKPVATKLKASQSIQINTAGIESVGRTQWTVVVFGQTDVTQSGAKARQDPFAAVVTMQHVGSRWLIAKINLVNTTA